MMSPKKPEVMFDVMPATGRAGLWDATPFSVALNDRATFLCAGEGIDLGELLVLLIIRERLGVPLVRCGGMFSLSSSSAIVLGT